MDHRTRASDVLSLVPAPTSRTVKGTANRFRTPSALPEHGFATAIPQADFQAVLLEFVLFIDRAQWSRRGHIQRVNEGL